MARSACWEDAKMKMEELDPYVRGMLSTRTKADRRMFRYVGDGGNTTPPPELKREYCWLDLSYTGLNVLEKSNFQGPTSLGAFVRADETAPAGGQFQTFSHLMNPFSGIETLFQNPITIKKKDFTFGSLSDYSSDVGEIESFVNNPSLEYKKHRDEILPWLRKNKSNELVMARRFKIINTPEVTKFTRNIDPLDDAHGTLYIGFSKERCDDFKRQPNDFYLSYTKIVQLIKDPAGFFCDKAYVVAGRDANGDGAWVDLQTVANPQRLFENGAVWLDIFREATGVGAYRPPRSLNPNVTIVLEHVSSNMPYKKLHELADTVYTQGQTDQLDANGTLIPKLLTSVGIFNENVHPNPDTSTDYFLLGSSPFGDYRTWIKHDKLYDFLRQRNDRDCPPSNALILQVDKDLVATNQKGSTSARLNDLRTAVYISSQVIPGANNNLLGDKSVSNKNYLTIATCVSARSLNAAVGDPRKGYPSQAAVWGGISATAVGNTFGWDAADPPKLADWPRHSFKAAEWLHRSAYSWGGLVDGAAGTSQVPENLIFGSSETNSIMTRYEQIWQELIRTANTKNDDPNTDTYGILVTETQMSGRAEKISVSNPVTRTYADYEKPDDKWQPWLCYQLDYRLQLVNPPENLRCLKYPPDQVFWPFQRMFFTRFEASLDKSIMNWYAERVEGVDIAAKDLVEEVGEGSDEDTEGQVA